MTPTTLSVAIGMVLALAGWWFLRRTNTTNTPIPQDELDRRLAEMRKAATEETPEEWIRYEASLALIHANGDKNAANAAEKRKTHTQPRVRALLRRALLRRVLVGLAAALGAALVGGATVLWGPAGLGGVLLILLLASVIGSAVVTVAAVCLLRGQPARSSALSVLRVVASLFPSLPLPLPYHHHKRERTETE